MTDWEVFWLMLAVCAVLLYAAASIHRRSVERDHRKWLQFWNQRDPNF